MIRLILATLSPLLRSLSPPPPRPRQPPQAPRPPPRSRSWVLANKILNDRGMLDAYFHLSIRHPRAIAPRLVTANDIMDFDLDSNSVDSSPELSESAFREFRALVRS